MRSNGKQDFIEFMGMNKTRDEWAAYLDCPYTLITSRGRTYKSIPAALQSIVDDINAKLEVVPVEITHRNTLFACAMMALIPQGLTSNEKIM